MSSSKVLCLWICGLFVLSVSISFPVANASEQSTSPNSISTQYSQSQQAAGEDTLITFSEFSIGTSITNQYAGLGIIFGGDSPFITSDGSNPTSPVLSGTPIFQGEIKGYFVNPYDGTTPMEILSFSLDAGYFNEVGTTRIQWFDENDNKLGEVFNTEIGIQHFDITGSNIASWSIGMTSSDSAGFAIDNVNFDVNLLQFDKDDGVDEGECVSPGDEIIYTICWDNPTDPNGNGPSFEDVYIIDYLPDGVIYPSGAERFDPNDPFNPIPPDQNYYPTDHSYFWDIGDIIPGDANCVTLRVLVDPNVTPGDYLYNRAEMWDATGRFAIAAVKTYLCCNWDGVDPNIIYVDLKAEGFNNGTSWQNAYIDLQDALYRADISDCEPENGYTIYVAQGTYSPGDDENDTYDLPDGVKVYGGFKTGGTDRNPDRYETILDGMVDPNEIEQNETVITMGDDTLIDGFVITEAGYYGVYAENSDVSVKWCKINHNGRHGIYHIGQEYTINIENSVVSNNNEHGLYTRFSTPTIKNSVVAKNGFIEEYFYGINIFKSSDVPVLHNNTIAHNKKAGIFYTANDPNFPNYPEIENCILWYNNDNYGQIYGHDPNLLFYNCIYDSNDIDDTNYTLDDNYNFTGNPNFAYSDPNLYDDGSIAFNPHLAYDSNCIDMGSPYLDYADQNDIDVEDRVVGLYADVGADEVYSCDDDLSEDDFYHPKDLNADGIVNLWEFNLLSAAWQTYEPNYPNPPAGLDDDDILRYDARCDFDSNWHVDNNDLGLLAKDWLWIACWKQSRMDNFSAAAMMMPGESMAMAMSANSPTKPTAEEQVANIEEILVFLNNLWINDKDMRKTIHKKQWKDFIAAIESTFYDTESGL